MIPIKIKYTAYCSLCENKYEVEYDLPFGAETPKFDKPEGWTRLDNYLFCDKHDYDEILDFLKSMV